MTTTTMTLTDFLLARYAEEERDDDDHDDIHNTFTCETVGPISFPCTCGIPARLRAEREAKRRIVAEHAEGDSEYCRRCKGEDVDIGGPTVWMYPVPIECPCPTLRFLALPYADHPDYDESWRP